MLFEIENFGPIRNAKIKKSDFTVFTGSNSSGKSYTALLIHTLLNPLDEKEKNFPNISFTSFEQLNKTNSQRYTKFFRNLKKYIKTSLNYTNSPFLINKDDFKILIDEGIGIVYKNIIEEKLKQVFEVDTLDNLINFNSDFFKIKFNNMILTKQRNKELEIENLFNINTISNNKDNFFKIKNKGKYYELYFNYLILENKENIDLTKTISMFYSHIANIIFENLFKNHTYYIPSTRDELLKNKNTYLSQNLKGKLSLSSTQKELASNLLDINPKSKKGDFINIANKLEKDLLDGIVDMEYIEPNTNLYFKNKDNISLPFNLVSSAVRELSPFILYLKYILKKGDTLVMEEPEAHLHPTNQRKLVKYFVEAINEGLNIIITTHSDYISDQLNNHIRLTNVKFKALKEEFNSKYSKEDFLNYKKINIYNFKNQDSGFIADEIDIAPTGFY